MVRIALVVQGLPPHSSTGAAWHAAALADALAELGHGVELVASRPLPGLAPLAQRREQRGSWAVTWIHAAPPAGGSAAEELAEAFGAFLDRERPEVVHFESLAEPGPALGRGRGGGGIGPLAVEQAKRRGLPTVGYVHDFHLASECPVLLRPDLGDLPLGDRDAEVRAALARAALAELDPRSAESGLVLADELPEAARARLRELLAGSLPSPSAAETTRVAVRTSLERKRAAFAALDARFASSRTVARRLSSVLGRAVDWRPLGVRAAPPRASAQPDAGRRAVRFAYVGELDKAGGLHLLLEAFSRLEGAAELAIHGDSPDRPYVGAMRERALEIGATWGGPIGPDGPEPLCAAADVLVAPSLWEEGPLFFARDALGARCAVIAPRTEAAAELVRDEADGLLFDRGDVGALTRALQRLVSEEWLVGRMQAEARAPRPIRAEAEDWVETYLELVEVARRRNPRPSVPAHLAAFAARHDELAARPTRELFAMVMTGLDALGLQMGLKTGPRDFLVTAAGRGSRTRDGIVADRRAIAGLTRDLSEHERARARLEADAREHATQLADLLRQVDRLGEAARGRERELAHVSAERDRLHSSKLEVERSRAALDAQLQVTRESLESLELERSFLARTLEEGAAEMRLLRERIAGAGQSDSGLDDRQALERHFDSLQAELGGLRQHEEVLRREMTELVAGLGARLGSDLVPPRREPLDPDELRAALESGQARLGKVLEELAWRRREMGAARRAAQSLFARIRGGALASRVRAWSDPDDAPEVGR